MKPIVAFFLSGSSMLGNDELELKKVTRFLVIVLLVNVNISFVEQMMENIDGINSSLALLTVAEYKINPL